MHVCMLYVRIMYINIDLICKKNDKEELRKFRILYMNVVSIDFVSYLSTDDQFYNS